MDKDEIRQLEIDCGKAMGWRYYVVQSPGGPLRMFANPDIVKLPDYEHYEDWNGDETIPIAVDAYRHLPRFTEDYRQPLEWLSDLYGPELGKDRDTWQVRIRQHSIYQDDIWFEGETVGIAICRAVREIGKEQL